MSSTNGLEILKYHNDNNIINKHITNINTPIKELSFNISLIENPIIKSVSKNRLIIELKNLNKLQHHY